VRLRALLLMILALIVAGCTSSQTARTTTTVPFRTKPFPAIDLSATPAGWVAEPKPAHRRRQSAWPVGSWLVRAWFTGPDGKRLSTAAAYNVIGRMYDGPANGKSRPVTLAVNPPLHLLGELPAGEPLLGLSDHRCGDPGSPGRTSGVRDRSACPSSCLNQPSRSKAHLREGGERSLSRDTHPGSTPQPLS